MKNAVKSIAAIVAVIMLFSMAACGSTPQSTTAPPASTTAPTEKPTEKPTEATAAPDEATQEPVTETSFLEPLTPYPERITITTGRQANAGGQFAPGQTSSSNSYLDMIRDVLNIDYVVDFDVVGGQYDQAVMLRAASGTLPDTFVIQNSAGSYALFKNMVAAGKLADLTDAYNNSIGGQTKGFLDAADKTDLLKYMTVDGKIYGITAGMEGYNTPTMWIRQDWLDKLGLSVPKTIDDVENVAKAFVEAKLGGQDNTIGICFNPDPNNGMFGQWFGLLPIFNAFGSYPDIWIDDGNGNAVHGAIQPETKEALGVMARWVQEGIFDKAMFTMRNGDETRDTYVATQACGIIFNAWWDAYVNWSGYGIGSVDHNEGMAWVPVFAPLNAAGQFSPKKETTQPGGQVVNITCKYPEAIIKTINLLDEVVNLRNPEYKAVYDKYIKPLEGISGARECFPLFQGSLMPNNNRLVLANVINDYKATGVLNIDPRVEGNRNDIEGAYTYAFNNNMADWYTVPFDQQTDENKSFFQYQYVGHWGFDVVGNLYLDGEKTGVFKEKPIIYNGQTESFSQYGDMLRDLVNTTFQQIMTGDQPLDYFDTFVARWKQTGGDIITAEVNEILHTN